MINTHAMGAMKEQMLT